MVEIHLLEHRDLLSDFVSYRIHMLMGSILSFLNISLAEIKPTILLDMCSVSYTVSHKGNLQCGSHMPPITEPVGKGYS
jgi:hypothetical protein